MTCIAATTKFLAADRLVTGGHSVRKVAQNEGMLVGVAGFATGCVAVRAALKAGAATPNDIKDIVKKHGCEALAVHRGRLWYVDGGGECWPIESRFWAIGSGGDVAYGHLAAFPRGATASQLRAAVRLASKRNEDCGRRVDVIRFPDRKQRQ